MHRYTATLTFEVRKRPEGGLIATCSQVPVLIVARDRPALLDKLADAVGSIERYVDKLPDDERLAFLSDHGLVLRDA